MLFLKGEFEGELQISKCNLFHSNSTDGKKNEGKVNSYFKLGRLPSFDCFLFGMNCYLKELSQIFGRLVFNNFLKDAKFLKPLSILKRL